LRGKPSHCLDGTGVAICRKDLETRLEEIDEVAAAATRRVQHTHPGAKRPRRI
jgi:hypothetical protein